MNKFKIIGSILAVAILLVILLDAVMVGIAMSEEKPPEYWQVVDKSFQSAANYQPSRFVVTVQKGDDVRALTVTKTEWDAIGYGNMLVLD